ncbi:ABC-type Fe3+-hydroxamate transport system, periplasmic component [Thioflavicoccus mobilis 8321]|uniref:ABC-type Fe3+-hydroxamate transport system, periplasmic component n=1 Tax=Thioflavicoccus mobilis 8321 TaxID=765912 RepID=L0H1K9_9GAMM|nr:ABC transporter substrate-binding protein [Thioflavicoccus mobilis]AGA91510.1 ABC-type Fe3+-hydroxamate transport system, periplasmic component [Thioflavicoccus mobilis 8321]
MARISGGVWALALISAAALVLVLILLDPPSDAFVAGGDLGGTQVIGEGFPKRLIDPLGHAHTLAAPPTRIVSAILAGDEMLADLVAPERVAAVTHLVDDAGISNVAGHYPATIPRISGDIEDLLAPRPDLVIVSTLSDALAVRLLLRAGVTVARFAAFDSFAEVMANIETLGMILGAEQRAAAVVADMRRRLAAVAQQVAGRPSPRVLFYSRSGSTGGPGSLTDEMIVLAGGYNVVRDTGITGYRRVTPELAIALQPEVIVFSDWSGSGAGEIDWLRGEPAWRQVPAVRDGRLYALRGAWVTSGSQFRVAGVEALAPLLHPEAFADAAH